jgi:lysophospholipase L1-like esterase
MTRRTFLQIQIILLFLFFTIGLSNIAEAAQQSPKDVDFSSVVVMGDSLSHSYHDGVLHADAQSQNYLSILSKQIGFQLRQGIIAEPGGFGSRFSLKDPKQPIKPLSANTFLNLTLPPEPKTAGRVDPSVRVNNFAIGGAKVTDIINARPDLSNPDAAVFSSLGVPWLSDNPPVKRSQLEFVEASKPTLAILLIGGNDALGAAFNSNLSLLTSPDKFLSDYEEIVRRTKATGAQMILVTVPDVVNVAAFISGKDLMAFIPIPKDSFVQKTGINPEDFVTLRAFSSLIDIVFGRSNGPIPEDQILRAKMAKQISKTVKKFNKGIQKIGKREGFLVIDVNKFLAMSASSKGFPIGNLTLTNKYFGGVASFDGIHLSITANAVLANLFIDEINKFYKKSFPTVDLLPIAMADPQVPKPTTIAQEVEETPSQMDWEVARPQFEAAAKALQKLISGNSNLE